MTPGPRRSSPALPALLVLALGMLTSVLAAWQLGRAAEAKDRERFENGMERARDAVVGRLDAYVNTLRGVAGLFASGGNVTRDRFRRYVRQLELPRHYPGAQGVGFTLRIPAADVDRVVADLRADEAEDFRVWPDHDRPERHAIVYLEPDDPRNQAAIGYDMFTEPSRRAAMERARDTGRPAASAKVRLVQEIDGDAQAGFNIYVPVYRGGGIPQSVEQRRDRLAGFVYSPFRADDLFHGIFGSEQHPRVDFEVYDGPEPTAEAALHRSAAARGAAGTAYRPTFTDRTTLDVYGRTWTVAFATRPDFELASTRALAPAALLVGLAVSGVLAAVTFGQAQARVAAERIQELLRKSEEELRTADRRKDEFLAVLAHELRNPLAPVRTAIHVLAHTADGPAAAQARGTMARQVGHMVRLIDDLLDVSRITRGKVVLQRRPVALNDVLAAAVETSRPLIDERRHTLDVLLPPRPLTLDADAVRLAQVFANLLNNAAKYTPPGGRITLTAEVGAGSVSDGKPSAVADASGSVVIRVRDTGEGIAADMLPKVFDLFTQVSGSSNLATGGLGLGLTLVKRLVEMHGGTVEAHSDGPGQGSEFVVRLPLRQADGGASAEEPPAVADSSFVVPQSSLKVLVVDDNRDAADMLATLLRLRGHEVAAVHDGAAALAAVDEFRPRVVLLDLGMPGLDGWEVARRLGTRPDRAAMTVVAVTGYGQDADRRRTADAGFDRHLVKPVDPDELLDLIAAAAPPPPE